MNLERGRRKHSSTSFGQKMAHVSSWSMVSKREEVGMVMGSQMKVVNRMLSKDTDINKVRVNMMVRYCSYN